MDAENAEWRTEKVVLLDNGSWHKSKEAQKTLAELEIPTMYLGPYSFDVAPCETFFSLLKRGQLNSINATLNKR